MPAIAQQKKMMAMIAPIHKATVCPVKVAVCNQESQMGEDVRIVTI